MSMAGGPAALKGFLYQLLHHIGHLTDARLVVGAPDGDAVTELVFEPAGGGDAKLWRGVSLVVEQYKSRKSTFAVSDVEAALADLIKAARPELGNRALYRIVSDARSGRLDTFMAFQSAVRCGGAPLHLDAGMVHRIGEFTGSHQAYLDHLAGGTPKEKLLHVLQRLEFDFGCDSGTLMLRLQRRLRPFSPEAGAEGQVIEQLLGMLLGRLAKGSLRLDPEAIRQLLESTGLNTGRLLRAARMPETLAKLTRDRLARSLYDHNQDVRAPAELPDADVVVYTARSGAGKTWSLARALLHHGDAGRAACFVVGPRSVQELLNAVSSDIWHTALGETSVRPWPAILNFLSQTEAPTPVVVGLDDVQDMALARDIVRTNWRELGIRIVMAVSEPVYRSLASQEMPGIAFRTVPDFSVDELDRYLRGHGRNWGDLPPDLKRLLRLPILARLYVGLEHVSFRAAPRSEYEIFEGFWKRISAMGPGDEGIVLALAEAFRSGGDYPVPGNQWSMLSCDADAVARLVASGWVHQDADGAVSFAHERFLNWAVARSLANAFRNARISAVDAALRATGEHMEFGSPVYRRLGYVPMDLLWICAAPGNDATLAVSLLGAYDLLRSMRTELYENLVPTLGDRILPHLLVHLRAAAANSDLRVTHGIENALVALAGQEGSTAAAQAAKLLSEDEPTLVYVATKVLAKRAERGVLDELWQVHQRVFAAYEDGTGHPRIRHYEASAAAMRAAVADDSEWLRRRIVQADGTREPISELGYLLFNLHSENADAIWRDVGGVFASKIPPDRTRSLMLCLARFGGAADVEELVRSLSVRDDWCSIYAFVGLCCIDPDRAARELPRLKESDASGSRAQWMPMLLHAVPAALAQQLLALGRAHEDKGWLVESLFDRFPDDMPADLLRFVLQDTRRKLAHHAPDPQATDYPWLTRPLDILTRIARPELLQILKGDEGRALSQLLLETAHRRLRTNSSVHDHLEESMKKFMAIAAMDHLGRVIADELDSPHYWVRHAALAWAYVIDSPEVRSRLLRMAETLAGAGTHPRARQSAGVMSEQDAELHFAVVALAALGADAELVRVVALSGRTDVATELAGLRRFRGAMAPSLSAAALARLEAPEATEDELVEALLIAWLSADGNFVSPVQALLERCEPDGLVARFCCIALRELDARSRDLVPLAARMLSCEDNRRWALDLLMDLGEPAVATLRKWVELGGATLDAARLAVLRALKDSSESEFVKQAANARYLASTPLVGVFCELLDPVGDPLIVERLIDDAFAPVGSDASRTLGAIETLRRVDPPRALHAALSRLEASSIHEAHLCELVMEISPESGPALLLQAAAETPRQSLADEVGRALRRAAPDAAAAALGSYLQGNVGQRKLAAELACWCPTPPVIAQVEAALAGERIPSVRNQLLTALLRRRHDDHLLRLFERFRNASWSERWSTLTTILEVGDPFLLARRGDALWLGNILGEDVPTIFERHADQQLGRRRTALVNSRSGSRERT